MTGWNLNIQRMLDFIELNLTEPLSLERLSKRLGYSPSYCTRQFHRVVGMSLRDYLRSRRLSAAALEIRDTQVGILDVALKFGFSSQEAFTRAFSDAFGRPPGAYRRSPTPLRLLTERRTYNPHRSSQEPPMINKAGVHSIEISIQSLPAHRFIGIRNLDASDYCDFWEKQEAIPNQDCHTITGLLESLKSINGQIGGWFREQGRRGYLYGIEVPADYEGSVPEGMECTLIPQSEYVVFHHPVYDFEKQDAEVWKAINTAMEAWNPAEHGFAYNDALPTYQRHAPERFGQAFCRPLLRIR